MADDETIDDPHGRASEPTPRLRRSDERFLVLSELGRGGMGVVERAYDTELQREVALKRVRRSGLDDRERLRLLHEARTMARLSHPNVVQVHDILATPGGELLIAMEYVRGGTLTDWVAREPSPGRRLHMLVQAGRGLAAAHDAGLVHRDFKPSNVLIGLDGRPRVTDFGLAQQAQGQEHDLAVVSAGAGSPAYMAPEQRDGRVSPAADQYAFCVASWLALTGELPFAGNHAQQEAAKKAGPPAFPTVAGLPRAVGRALRRGLSPQPGDRFRCMDALLDALEPSAERPNRGLALLQVFLVLTMLLVGLLGLRQLQAQRCSGAAAALAQTWDQARAATLEGALAESGDAQLLAPALMDRLGTWTMAWQRAHTEACEAHVVRREQSAAVMDQRMACLDLARRRLDAQLEVLTSSSPPARSEVAESLLLTLPEVDACSDLQALSMGAPPPSQELREAALPLWAQLARGRSLIDARRLSEAEALLQETGPLVEALDHPPMSAELRILEGELLAQAGRHEEARRALETGLSQALELQLWDLATEAVHELVLLHAVGLKAPGMGASLLAVGEGMLAHSGDPDGQRERLAFDAAILREAEGDLAGAVDALERALALRERRLGEGPALAGAKGNLAAMLTETGDVRRALELFESAVGSAETTLGSSAVKTLLLRAGRGVALTRARRTDEALAELRLVEGPLVAQLGPDHQDVRTLWLSLADALLAADRPVEAIVPARQALESALRVLGPAHVDTASARSQYAKVLVHAGRLEEGVAAYRDAVAAMELALGPRHHRVAGVRLNLGTTLADLQRRDEARRQLELARDIWVEVHGEGSYFVALADFNLGELARADGDEALAVEHWLRAEPPLRERLPPAHPWLAGLDRRLGRE